MSKKVDLDLVKVVMQRRNLDVRTVAGILEEINEELAAQVDEEKAPAVKKQFVILVSDPHGHLGDKEYTGFVVQIPESEGVAGTEGKLIAAAKEFNATPKGRRLPVRSIAEVCEHVPARFTKDKGVWVKTKEPVYVVTTANKFTP